jgi:DegV family protein with EDD domain
MGGVAIVTDSTADIPPDMADDRGLRVVPMTVTFGEESFVSGVTLQPERFYAMLETSVRLPTTAQPAAAWFEEAYGDAEDSGADAVVSIHLSAELSGTYNVARKVAEESSIPVTVVDSRLVSGGLALVVLAALRAAERDAAVADVVAASERVAEDVAMYFVVDDLEYLRRGGRLTGAQKVVGSMLRVKPVLTIRDGRVEPMEKVRTWSRAIERIGELAGDYAGGDDGDVVVAPARARDRAAGALESVRAHGGVRAQLETVIGPVVGVHAGPGAVGVALARVRE